MICRHCQQINSFNSNYPLQEAMRTLKSSYPRAIDAQHTVFGLGADDELAVRVAEKPGDIEALLETGFEYFCWKSDLLFFRKRK